MSLRTIFLTLFITTIAVSIGNTQSRNVEAIRIDGEITIDGEFSDWPASAPSCNDFILNEPRPGDPSDFDTEVSILYDDQAIYIKALLADTLSLIRTDLTARDETGNGDWFGIFIDPYANGLTATSFLVTAAGVQIDSRWEGDNSDTNWDAVWNSKVVLTEDGWQVEIEIPYAALRFGDDDVQDWYINFGRYIRRNRQIAYWSPIDPAENGVMRQAGTIQGITDIESPLRLSLTPFVVGTNNTNVNGSSNTFGAGMDLKYGLTEAFTLDMTLIPDFSQVQSDDVVVNLSPFEQFFEERRQFFTEGIDLFERAGIFYSRRIGGNLFSVDNVPDGSDNVVIPTRARLLNASKISGRFQNGSGLGLFNAVEAKEEVVVDVDGSPESVTIHPLTNYNVVVYDHVMKNNSYVSLINTNVLRQGDALDANVTGTEFQLRTPSQKWQLSGQAAVSQRVASNRDNAIGHKFGAIAADIHGKWITQIEYNEESDTYNPNDLGFLFNNNERSANYYIEYNQYEQTEKFTRWRMWSNSGINALYRPNIYTGAFIEAGGFWFTRNFFAFGFSSGIFHNDKNYFEPRTSDFSRYWDQPNGSYFNPFISTDYSKMFAIDARINRQHYFNNGRRNTTFTIEPRVQINSRWLVVFESNYTIIRNREGFVNKASFAYGDYGLSDDDILFGLRNRNTLINTISTNYVFTNRMSMDLRIRHYWDQVDYDEYYTLEDEGQLERFAFDGIDENGDPIFKSNINLFNIDLNYYWRYAPGSDIIFSYKNNAFNNAFLDGYNNNLNSLFDGRSNHTFSLKILYFLDVNQVAQGLRRKNTDKQFRQSR